jgi:hypothetical protein
LAVGDVDGPVILALAKQGEPLEVGWASDPDDDALRRFQQPAFAHA